jgi:hypothetical protein
MVQAPLAAQLDNVNRPSLRTKVTKYGPETSDVRCVGGQQDVVG